MFELFGLLFGCTLVVGSVGVFVAQCGSKSRRAKKQSVKSAKSAKKSAKRAGKKAGQSAKQAGIAAKEGVKEKAQSSKSKRSSHRSSRRSARRSSRLGAEPSIGQKIANKAQDAKEVVKEKLEVSFIVSVLPIGMFVAEQEGVQIVQVVKVGQVIEVVEIEEVAEIATKEDGRGCGQEAFVQQQLCVEPRELHFEPGGGIQKVNVLNSSAQRQAVKVKCSDTQTYRVSPVYAFIEPGNSYEFDVQRQNGAKKLKLDQLVFLVAQTDAKETNPKSVFKSLSTDKAAALVLPLKV
ncbi:Major sperm protein [Aphelenchoides besseyi]|nr:Major sperm protein [Aphelenchoides besseyi]KAI6210871.1 Major sperm protein [Aphelenchoides besseyi]